VNDDVYGQNHGFCRESLRLQLIRELSELVEIDPRPEPKDPKEWGIVFGAGRRRVALPSPMPARIVRYIISFKGCRAHARAISHSNVAYRLMTENCEAVDRDA
jgi:hypothetical protein